MDRVKVENMTYTSHSLCLWWTQSRVPGLQASRLFSGNLSAWKSKNTTTGIASFKDLCPLKQCRCIRKEGRCPEAHEEVGEWVHLLKFFLFFVGLTFEFRVLSLQSRHSISWATPSVHFTLVILEMGSHKLFAQVGLELQSFWSQPPTIVPF
jgi:hypothetical protein